MTPLVLHEFHQRLSGQFTDLNGQEIVAYYDEPLKEHAKLTQTAGVFDLSFRGRICLAGVDRQRFLNGQVTNNVKDLKVGEGCYAALITAKGKMLSDLNIYILENEILLDFEPGLNESVPARLEKYIIADDVQIVNVAEAYGLLSVQGPRAGEVVAQAGLGIESPEKLMGSKSNKEERFGEIYLMNQPRTGASGFDLFVPTAALESVAGQLNVAAERIGGGPCGWQALEIGRIEAGIPRFGADMDESNLAPEAGLDAGAISYSKGCYIGQEVLARIRTYGQVTKTLRGLRLAEDLKVLPQRGDKLFKEEKEVGFITSAIDSPTFRTKIALGYVRREANGLGTELTVRTAAGDSTARVVALPFSESA